MNKITDRQVSVHDQCFLFGHYDSRGGGFLVIADHLIMACQIYATNVGHTLDEEGNLQDPSVPEKNRDGEYTETINATIHAVCEDLMFSCTVIVCDEPFEGKTELDGEYDDDGYSYGTIEIGFKNNNGETQWEDFRLSCSKTLIFWKGEEPTLDPKLVMPYIPNGPVRIVRQSYGEDACGISWMM